MLDQLGLVLRSNMSPCKLVGFDFQVSFGAMKTDHVLIQGGSRSM
jgi:hypothetical protein